MSRLVVAMGIALLATSCGKAVDDYEHKSKTAEAPLNLSHISKLVKLAYGTDSAFPAGTAKLLPAEKCCGQPDNKCPAATAAFKADPVWAKLDFSVDEPGHYQYSYAGDATHVTAYAIGDLDCDQQFATYTLTMQLNAGNPQTLMTSPPHDVW